MNKKIDYSIGVDIGTESVGYAVVLENGRLVKFKGKNMWGVRTFTHGETAKSTRLARSVRRRYARRKQRIGWLQSLVAQDVILCDATFFDRLEESFLHSDDRNSPQPYILFNDPQYDEKSYFAQFPTIYHLRQRLVEDPSKADIRLVYLALHHIIKYRGNFLYEGQSLAGGIDLQSAVLNVLQSLPQMEDVDIQTIETMSYEIAKVIKDKEIFKKDKKKSIAALLKLDKEDKDVAANIAAALVGSKINVKKLFKIEDGEELSLSLADEGAYDKVDGVLDDGQQATFDAMMQAYSAAVLCGLLSSSDGETTFNNISQAMVEKFIQHKRDLKEIKGLFRKYELMEKYNDFFKNESKEGYAQYITQAGKCGYDKLKTSINAAFAEKKTEPDVAKMLEQVENDNFLLKINSKENGAIPYQLNLQELESILNNQGKYYPTLKENTEKIISILKYKIPYYVGPLSTQPSRFNWMERKAQGEIYPWNFDEIIDKDGSAEKFINRMRNKCTYLYNEETLPKCSLLYSEYEVRSEIKQIKLDDNFLCQELQNDLYEELFKTTKTIKEATLKKWLKTKGITPQKITGYQKDKEFATSLKAYIDFKKIFGKVDGTNKEIIEKIILWITIFTEKEIIERKIRAEYPQITTAEINKILNLKYKGWAKLSEKLLVGLTVEDNGVEKSIMDIMRSQKLNFMQIINSKKLGFNVLIDEENDTEKIETLGYEQVEDIHTSPANKKGIWQTILIIKEIEHIMGHSPKNIYVEFAREDGKSARTVSRYTKLEKLYIEAAKNSEEYKQVLGVLRKECKADKKALDDRALYLYFMQNGKCLYSGNTLDIHSLHLYEIDHIIPRSYIKDDSFENLALVCRTENQHKGAAMLLNKDIINSQKHIWLSLFKNGLMSSKKFNNLTREAFSDEDMQGFIARQLVETRQITKHVTQLLTAHYVNTNIVAIKAELSSNLRKKYELYKNRDVNDYHHAYDAFLACTMGRYIRVCYPSLEDEFIYKEYRKFATATGTEKNGFGYIVDFFGKNKINGETGEVIWCGEDEIKQLVKAYSYKDCFVSRKTERLTGAFYNQTINPKSGDKTTKLIPLKENLPVSKYGGYNGIEQAYYVVIEYDKGKTRELKLEGVPVSVVELKKTRPNAVAEHFEKQGYKNAKIIKDDIKKYQKINYQGNERYIVGVDETINAKQLVLSREDVKIITLINNPYTINNVEPEQINRVIDNIIAKMESQYPYYVKVAQRLKANCDAVYKMDAADKAKFINEMLKITKASSAYGAFKKFEIPDLKDRMDRKGGKILQPEEIEFIDTSVTGMLETKSKIL